MHLPRRTSLLALPLLVAWSGCGYVHVGRLPEPVATVVGDGKLLEENTELRLEKKLLEQELALTRAQTNALRMAIENRAADGATSQRLVEELNNTTRELAALRASYAQLQVERTRVIDPNAETAALRARLGETEEKLAASLHSYTQLQEEISRLKSDVTRARVENLALSQRVQVVTARNVEAQAALAQLNQDLLAQKDARLQAEHAADALRIELKSIAPDSPLLAQQRTGSAGATRSLAAASATEKAPPAPAVGPAPVVVKPIPPAAPRTHGIVVRPGGVNATLVTSAGRQPRILSSSPDTTGARLHTVASGDTLARISTHYYGDPARWSDILAANRDVLAEGNTLVIGRTLRIP